MRRSDGKPLAKARRFQYGVTKDCNRKKPWLVKFGRNKRTVYVGYYADNDEACAAAINYLENEK